MPENCGTVTVRPAFDPSLVSTGGCEIGIETTTPGDTITVTGRVENGNEYDDTSATVALLVDGVEQNSTTVPVSAAGSETVSFELTFTDTGEYDLELDVVDASPA